MSRTITSTPPAKPAPLSVRPELYGQLVDNIADYAVFVVDRIGRIADWNRASQRVYGYEAAEIIGRPLTLLTPPEHITEEAALVKRVLRGASIHEHHAIRVRKDGRRIDVVIFMSPIRDQRGKIIGAFKVVRDITERKRFLEALRENEQRLRAIVETAAEAIITINDHGVIETANPAAYALFGYTAGELPGRNVSLLMPQPYRREHDSYMRNYLDTGHAKIIGIGREVTGARKDGSTFPIHLSISEVKLGDARLFTGIIHDLTARRALEKELLEASANEQRRIGRDLHDGLCQELVALGFTAKMLADRLARLDLPETDMARQLGQAIRDATAQARQLSHGLNPVDVKAGGLGGALEHLALKVSKAFAIRCTFQLDPAVQVKGDAAATHLYRIAQEAVSNAIRHGKATRVQISLSAREHLVLLTIKDNGIGFARAGPRTRRAARRPAPAEAEPPSKGIGLQSMAYRARVIGGEFRIAPGPRGGTVVTVSVHAGAAQ